VLLRRDRRDLPGADLDCRLPDRPLRVDRLRDLGARLPRWQRAVLAALSGTVLVMLVAVLVIAGRDGDDAGADGGTPGLPETTTTTLRETTSTSAPTTSTTTVPTSTTSTTTPPTTTTTEAPPDTAGLVLRPDGIGPLPFGADADRVVDRLVGYLGDPDEDTGWVDVSEYGACIGSTVRFVRWASLRIFLTDGPSDWAPADTPHLAAYENARELGTPVLDLRTENGIRVGLPVGDLRTILGDGQIVGDDLLGAAFAVDPPGPGILWGLLSGLDATDVVESVAGGFSCGE
jgi:hypothetical protein